MGRLTKTGIGHTDSLVCVWTYGCLQLALWEVLLHGCLIKNSRNISVMWKLFLCCVCAYHNISVPGRLFCNCNAVLSAVCVLSYQRIWLAVDGFYMLQAWHPITSFLHACTSITERKNNAMFFFHQLIAHSLRVTKVKFLTYS